MQEFIFRMLDDGTFGAAGYSGDAASVDIPGIYNGQPVTMLLDDLFKGHAEIERVSIPDTVTDIGGFVFDGCERLKHVQLPSGLRYMWQYAFARCGIEEIVIPEKVKDIVPFTFKDCRNLKRIICGPGLKEISAWAFCGCGPVEEFIHDPGTKVSEIAFAGDNG